MPNKAKLSNEKSDINFVILNTNKKLNKVGSNNLQIFKNNSINFWLFTKYLFLKILVGWFYGLFQIYNFISRVLFHILNYIHDSSDAIVDTEARELYFLEIRVFYKIILTKIRNGLTVLYFFVKKLYLLITVVSLILGLKLVDNFVKTDTNSKSFINQAFDNYSQLNNSANDAQSYVKAVVTTNKQIVDVFPLNKITVKANDKIEQIAERQNLTIDTILINNDIQADKPLPKELIVPWQDGYIYFPKADISPKEVADKYKIDEKIIYEANEDKLNNKGKLIKDSTIIIPTKNLEEIKKIISKEKNLLKIEEQSKQINDNQSKLAKSYQDQFTDTGSGGFKYATTTSEEKRTAGLIWPTKGSISRCIEPGHPGCDIANPDMPPVYAVADGVVIDVYRFTVYGYGNAVVIDHGNGLTSLSAHLNEIYVAKGQLVSQGQSIGQMGNTGNSTGTHLHIEIKQNKIAQNPLAYFP